MLSSLATLAVSCNGGQPAEQSQTAAPSATALTTQPQTAATTDGPTSQHTPIVGPFGFGRHATAEEIGVLDIDVSPDGAGLPPGRGIVEEGEDVYVSRCAVCHGRSGEGVPGASGAIVLPYDLDASWPPFPRTVGNYWPFSTTLFDYINRAMPANAPGSLEPDEVYGVVAWLLYKNDIIESDEVMDSESLPKVEMPARHRFVLAPGTP